MMKNICVSVLILFSIGTHAELVHVEPDNFEVGTNITNAFEGVTIQAVYITGWDTETEITTVAYSDAYVATSAREYVPTGTKTFGYRTPSGVIFDLTEMAVSYDDYPFLNSPTEVSYRPYYETIFIFTFDSPTDYVSIQGGGWHAEGNLGIAAYNEAGELLVSAGQGYGDSTANFVDGGGHIALIRDQPDIKYLLAAGSTEDAVTLDNFVFHSTTEYEQCKAYLLEMILDKITRAKQARCEHSRPRWKKW